MTEINKKCIDIESFFAPSEGARDIGKVSLFRVSSKNSGLKKINLESLTLEERSEKLKMWGKEHRFVLVIEKGDIVFAHTHAKYAEQLQNLDALSLNDRKVKVVALSEEQASHVSAIGIAFEEYVLGEEEVEEKNEELLEKNHDAQMKMDRPQSKVQVTVPKDQGQTRFLITQMVKMNLGSMISQCLKRFQEARQELKQQEKEDLKREELKKEVIQYTVKKGQIQEKELKTKIIKDLQ